jgi:hypothetical protein
MHDPTELREALAAVLEALDIPHAATVGDERARAVILAGRSGHAVAMLRGILGEDATADVPWSVAYLRGPPRRAPGYRLPDVGAGRGGPGRAAKPAAS